jgi:hypothetical protein
MAGNTKGGSITVPLTSCLTGLESADNFWFYLQNRLIHTSQTGGQQYSDTSPFSIPWLWAQATYLDSLLKGLASLTCFVLVVLLVGILAQNYGDFQCFGEIG